MKDTEIPQNGNVQPMTERDMTNHNQHLLKIREYLLETIAQAADEIKEIDSILKAN